MSTSNPYGYSLYISGDIKGSDPKTVPPIRSSFFAKPKSASLYSFHRMIFTLTPSYSFLMIIF